VELAVANKDLHHGLRPASLWRVLVPLVLE
jgi:hypothetical protein